MYNNNTCLEKSERIPLKMLCLRNKCSKQTVCVCVCMLVCIFVHNTRECKHVFVRCKDATQEGKKNNHKSTSTKHLRFIIEYDEMKTAKIKKPHTHAHARTHTETDTYFCDTKRTGKNHGSGAFT